MQTSTIHQALYILKEFTKVLAFLGVMIGGVGGGMAGLQYMNQMRPHPTVAEYQAKCDAEYRSCSAYATNRSEEPR